jgi:hypothetical protein
VKHLVLFAQLVGLKSIEILPSNESSKSNALDIRYINLDELEPSNSVKAEIRSCLKNHQHHIAGGFINKRKVQRSKTALLHRIFKEKKAAILQSLRSAPAPCKGMITELVGGDHEDPRGADYDDAFSDFIDSNLFWLRPYALYMICKEQRICSIVHKASSFFHHTTDQFVEKEDEGIESENWLLYYYWAQYELYKQLKSVKTFARNHGVQLKISKHLTVITSEIGDECDNCGASRKLRSQPLEEPEPVVTPLHSLRVRRIPAEPSSSLQIEDTQEADNINKCLPFPKRNQNTHLKCFSDKCNIA